MRFFALSIKIIFALYLAKFTAQQVLVHNYYVIGIFFVGFVVILFTSWKQRFYAFSIFVILPFSFPATFSLPFLYWSDFFAIVFFGWFFIELLMKKQRLLSKRSSLLLSAIAVITLWSIFNYIFNPVSGASMGAGSHEGGIRAYLIIISGICTFWVGFWFFKYEKINAERCLLVFLLIVLVLGNLRIAGYSIPLLGPAFSVGYWVEEEGFYRVSGLRTMSLVSFPVFFSYYFRKRWNIVPFLILFNIALFCVLGSGRALFIGILFATLLYYVLINRKHLLPVIAIVLMCSTIYVLFLSNVDFTKSKYSRVIAIEGGLEQQNKLRYYSYLYMWRIFLKYPILGKGIVYEEISQFDDFFKEYPAALEWRVNLSEHAYMGSHGAYMSILSTFGIGGIYFLIVMLFGGMYHACRIARRPDSSDEEVRLAIFVFVYLGIMSIHMYTGGAGYDYRDTWFLPGVVAGLLARDKETVGNIL